MLDFPDSLKAEYERLASDRSPYLERARDAAKYTVPTLIPPAGRNAGAKLRHTYSNFGARCVNTMSAKYLMALLPARQAFFRYVLEDRVLQQVGKEQLANVEAALASIEDIVQTDIETTPTRNPAGEAIKHLLIGGNVLAYDLPEGGLKVYGLQSFVVCRDGTGTVLAHIAEDRMAPASLPASIRGVVAERLKARRGTEKTVCVYTGAYRTADGWKVWQEVEGIKVPDSDGTYPLDASPWMPLRYLPVDGESYGRSMVEDYLGYFISLEGLTASLVKGTAAMAKLVYLRKPGGVTKAATIARAETGDVVDGNPEDVQPMQSNKAADFREVREMIGDLKEELAFAFGLSSAVQRNAERVTAEEIRFMAQELDATNGGTYSAFAQDLQLPLLRSRMRRLQKASKLPQLPPKALRPMIVTGLDALARGAELDNLRSLAKDVVDLGGAEALDRFMYFDDFLKRLTTARGIKPEGLIKPAEVVAQESQQRQIAALVERLGPNAITQMGQLAKEGAAAPQGTPA